MIENYFNFNGVNILDNKCRRKIYTIIQNFPGSHFHVILNYLKENLKVINWHLQILEMVNLIRKKVFISGSRKVIAFYPFEHDKNKDLKSFLLNILNFPKLFIIFKAIKENGKLTTDEVSKITNIRYTSVKYHLKKLEDVGFIKSHNNNNIYTHMIKLDNVSLCPAWGGPVGASPDGRRLSTSRK
ncbi:MAG: winged helix-turn-helix transcriptional regulator [Promethearchaeota archaeon]